MKRMIRTIVEVSGAGWESTDYHDLPDDWGNMTQRQRDDYVVMVAVEHMENEVSCGGDLVEVDDDFEG
jgi:hypothetical protein